MKNIIVTGANGQLGSDLQVLAKQNNNYQFHFFGSKELDITNTNAVSSTIKALQPIAFINCAAYTAVDKAETDQATAFQVNADAVKNITAICLKTNSQLVHVSSDYVYHNEVNRPLVETDPTTPKGIYAASKLEGDISALKLNPATIVLRTSWVYSSFGNNFLKTMLRLGKERDQLGIVYDQIGVPTYARDIAKTILIIIKKVEQEGSIFGGIYNYAPQGVTSWYDYAKAIFQLENIDCQVNSIPSKAYPTPAQRPHYSVLNCDKIKQTFDLDIPYWKDSVAACLQVLKREMVH